MIAVQIYENTFDTVGKEAAAEIILSAIKSGKWKYSVEGLRILKGKEYDEAKKTLPAVTFGGTFSKRKAENIIAYSGLLIIDIDPQENLNVKILAEKLKNDVYCRACFVSPSGGGLKVLFAVNCDASLHLSAFLSAEKYFKETYNAQIDQSGKDVNRLCYISYDPDLYYNKDSIPFPVDQKFIKTGHDRGKYEGKEKITDPAYIYAVVIDWVERKFSYTEGERNSYIHNLACNLNRCGVKQDKALEMILANTMGLSDKEIERSVKSAYQHNYHEHGSISVVDIGDYDHGIPEPVEYDDNYPYNKCLHTIKELCKNNVSIKTVKDILTGSLGGMVNNGSVNLSPAEINDVINKAYLDYCDENKDAKIDIMVVGDESFAKELFQQANAESITTGFDCFPPLKRGNFYGMIGREGTFKSILSQRIALINSYLGVPALYLNGEMSTLQLYDRVAVMSIQERLEGKSESGVTRVLAKMKDRLKSNLFVSSARKFNPIAIVNTVLQIKEQKGDIGLIVVDGLSQMDDGGKDEFTAVVRNSEILKGIAKDTNTAIIGLAHVKTGPAKHMRNTAEMTRGGNKIIAYMDGYFCTSLVIDAPASNLATDDIKYLEGYFYVRMINKREAGKDINVVIHVQDHLKLVPSDVAAEEWEVNLKQK